ncbi:hypothetical protein RJ639_027410 [Escallonia herrerae]|uniref:Uncharacterized protein n=1 Tax=Escallonia herrerae TaxID=1293975 RepID=A0AA88X4G1_9ASTE|nr:hypothetical protein RJ639_027410 [Escallonia herrerae]
MGRANAKLELGNYTFDQEFARRELGSMIILHEYPLSIVDHVGFRRYSSALQPLFKVPTRNTIKNDIIKIYDHERVKTMKLLEGIKSRVAITTNLWTSGNQKKGFMAVTSHFIDEDFVLQSRILRFIPEVKRAKCSIGSLVPSYNSHGGILKLGGAGKRSSSSVNGRPMMTGALNELHKSFLLASGTLGYVVHHWTAHLLLVSHADLSTPESSKLLVLTAGVVCSQLPIAVRWIVA